MKNRKGLTEYLFLDETRIERYFQQLSAPIRYDKLPVWRVALGLTGASVEGTQSRPGREFSFNEKLEEVVKHLESEGLIQSSRPYSLDENEKPFVSETLSARRARIEREGKALNIWVSLHPDKQARPDRFAMGALYLIEDFRGPEEPPASGGFSGYSSLWLLADELKWVAKPLGDPIKQLKQHDSKMQQFASDPVHSLKLIGAKIGPERRIQAIYRFRASCWESVNRSIMTIGYPLIIREA